MEYLDLSPYEYRKFPIPMRSVGWLGPKYGVQGINSSPAVAADVKRLASVSRRLGSVMLGTHECEFCPEASAFEGNGEYRYYSQDGEVYSAPMMILHYIKEHGYSPPREFLENLRVDRRLDWDWRADNFVNILLDGSEDLDFRCEAIIDLANWEDVRSLDALKLATRDEELVDVAGDEIGRSLALLLPCKFASDIRVEDFPEAVRFGIDQILRQ
ncbi:DUF7919 family protein [Kitasatospora cineracea]|uniref:DUF7919 family protein n=1 Tax=Kitasatospora cineracea TaxID=88074 RepID=UPI0037B9FF16